MIFSYYRYNRLPSNYIGTTIGRVFGTGVNALEFLLTERNLKGPNWLEITSPNPVPPQRKETWCQFQFKVFDMKNIRTLPPEDSKLKIPPIVLTTLNIQTAIHSNQKDQEIAMIYILTQNNFNISGGSESAITEEICFISKPSACLSYPKLENYELHRSSSNGSISIDQSSSNGSISINQSPSNGSININQSSSNRSISLNQSSSNGSISINQSSSNESISIIQCRDEQDLLTKFLDKFVSIDSDILMGYDCNFPLTNLISRIIAVVPQQYQNKIKRLKRRDFFLNYSNQRYILQQVLCRPLCDIKVAISDMHPKMSLDLDGICSKYLETKLGNIREISPCGIIQFYSSAEDLIKAVRILQTNTLCIKALADKMNLIPLCVEMTAIVGHVISRILAFMKNERNEFLLLHEFYKAGYIIPDKQKTHKAVKFQGGLVLDAKPGLHEDISLLMDFR